jgi:hypothetical protein
MITTLEAPGITIHGDAEASFIQKAEVDNTTEVDKVLTTIDGKTQIGRVFDHTEVNKFSVTGKGDLTLASGVGGDPDLTLITGGQVHIASFKYSQELGKSSEWTYAGEHYPHASEA